MLGRKTHVSDAGWLRQLYSYGLLQGSFRPDAEFATRRVRLRRHERLVEYAAAHIEQLQKALMAMNLQPHHFLSDITGATSMRIIRAIVAGERDPDVLRATAISAAIRQPRRSGPPYWAMSVMNTSLP